MARLPRRSRRKDPMAAKKKGFEESMTRLEAIVEELENLGIADPYLINE